MKIVIDARFYGSEHTGLGRYTMNVLANLPKYLKDHQLIVLLRSKYYTTLSLPTNCLKIRCDLPHYTVIEQFKLPLLLHSFQPDLFYSFHFNTPVFSKVPMVVTVHDLIKTYFSGQETTTRSLWMFRVKRLGYRFVVSQTLNRATKVIVPTNTVKNQILANFPRVRPENIYPIPEAPDPVFRNGPVSNSDFQLSDLPTQYLLFVGNAYPHKNLQVLLRAYRELKNKELSLVIISKHTSFLARTLAPYEQRLIHVYSDLTDPELATLYANAKILITPSLMEGYGLPGLEALMVGTPVIASNIPVYREVYGDKVTYFDPHDSEALKNAINTVMRRPRPQPLTYPRTWDDVSKSIAEVINACRVGVRST